MIFNSMALFPQHYEAQYNGLENALNFTNGKVGLHTSNFVTHFDKLKQNKIIVDVLMMVFRVVPAGIFNSWLEKEQTEQFRAIERRYQPIYGPRYKYLKIVCSYKFLNFACQGLAVRDSLNILTCIALMTSAFKT